MSPDLDPVTVGQYRAAVARVQSLIRGSGDARSTGLPFGATSSDELLSIRERRMARMGLFLDRLGNPERTFRSIHVGGTSGKGSTSALIHGILTAAGATSALHTTPYLQEPIEKLVIGERYLAPSTFTDLVAWIWPHLVEMDLVSPFGPVSYGECWVALTFACFAREGVDFGVIEVGHGGRWDYTNVLASSVAVITSIGLDHMRSLGPSLSEIAHHKAGIIKSGRPVVVGPVDVDPLRIISEEASLLSSPLLLFGRDFCLSPQESSASRLRYRGPGWTLPDLSLSMRGRHQVVNAAMAIAAVEALGVLTEAEAQRAVTESLFKVRFPGRLEVVQLRPTVVLDGAHNAQKAEALASALQEEFTFRRLVLVFGSLASKQSEDMLEILAPLADTVITTATVVYHKNSSDPSMLAEVARRFCRHVETAVDPLASLEIALAMARPDDLICVTGSLYLVGAVRERWTSGMELLNAAEKGIPPPAHVG